MSLTPVITSLRSRQILPKWTVDHRKAHLCQLLKSSYHTCLTTPLLKFTPVRTPITRKLNCAPFARSLTSQKVEKLLVVLRNLGVQCSVYSQESFVGSLVYLKIARTKKSFVQIVQKSAKRSPLLTFVDCIYSLSYFRITSKIVLISKNCRLDLRYISVSIFQKKILK